MCATVVPDEAQERPGQVLCSLEVVSTPRRCWLWAVRTWTPNSRAPQILCWVKDAITVSI